jgi:beta-galactosidase
MLVRRAIAIVAAALLAPLTIWGGAARPARAERLDGGWEYYQGSLGGLWEVWRGNKASDNVTWTPVTLPHCFNARDSVDPDARYYQGPGWYRTRLALNDSLFHGRLLLHFEGAGQKTQVFVGMEKVGEHTGGYDEWTVDITDAASRARALPGFGGVVPLAVLCDNARDLESIPSDLSDFNRYGGLYRHVDLVSVPALALERVHIESSVADGGKGTVKVRARIWNPAGLTDACELTVDVSDAQGQIIQSTTQTLAPWSGERPLAAFEIAAPRLWSPSQPVLYRCVVTLRSRHGTQRVEERFGFRSFEFVPHGPFLLNGQRLLLRGTHYHEDHAGVAAAVPDEVVRKTLRMIKEMGANFVRLGHYQQAPLVLQLCDELGLLVWEEIPWCRGGLGGERYQRQARDMLRALIEQHSNHPAVILWGLGNENDWPGDFEVFDPAKIRAFMVELNTLAHQLDPTRKTAIRRCDFCKDVPEVYSPSIWAGWYSGRYPEYKKAAEKEMKSVDHFFHAEWGGDSHARRHSEDPEAMLAEVATGQGTAEKGLAYKLSGGKARASKDGDWSETYICNLFDWHLKEQEQMPWLTGNAQWIFKDFATPLRPENPVPRVNQKGVVERDLTPKEGYYVFQSYWAETPMVHIYGHTWPVRWGDPGAPKLVKVYSNCPEVELFVNGRSAGVKQRQSADFPAAGLRWIVKLDEGSNQLRAVGRRGSAVVGDEITVAYQTAKWGKPATLALQRVGQAGALATLEARLLDGSGIACLDAANLVRFAVAGDGTLVDNLGTSTGARVVQLYNGRAQIQVHLAGPRADVSVASASLPTAFATVSLADPPLLQSGARTDAGKPDVAAIDRARIMRAADAALAREPITITAFRAPLSEGGIHDFYSNGDYWWPDPAKPDGLPYIRRDGESNPNNFQHHRLALRQMRDAVSCLAAAWKITGDERYARQAALLLRDFFLDPQTRMAPHLKYAQAVPGRAAGRPEGIIDALHLIEVPLAIRALEGSAALEPVQLAGLKQWFRDLLQWMRTDPLGVAEASAKNNHAMAFQLQVAVYADFSGDRDQTAACRQWFRKVLLPKQMAADGSFPLELARTKPYGYSIFQLDNVATFCQVLSTSDDNLWDFALPDGRGIRRGVKFLFPFLADKSKWPHKPDVQAWEGWPARQPCLLFAGLALGEPKYLELWQKLQPDPSDDEVRRNIAVTQPLLWLR